MRVSTLCYPERGELYLMLHRTKKKNDLNHDKWIGVGGGLEIGETIDECLLREVREETGLTLTRYHKRGIVDFVSDIAEDEQMHLYTADAWTGTMIVCDEGDLAWIDKREVPKLELWEGDRIFLRLLREDVPEFHLRLEYSGDKLMRAVLNGREMSRREMQLP